MKIALAQMKMSENMEDNFWKTIHLIHEAASKDAQLVLFPEIQLSPFFPQYAGGDASEYLIGPDHRYIREIRRTCRDTGIFASPNFYVGMGDRRYDMSLLIDDEGELIGWQKMVHVAQCEKFYEQDYYYPSEECLAVFHTRLGRIGIVVCFDRHYPESIRTEALRGADLILIPTANTTAEPSQLFQWEVKVQAFHSKVNIAMCNRVGQEDEMEFSGESIVCDYNGETLALAGAGEELLLADIDIDGSKAAKSDSPYLNLRRKGLYE